MKINRLSIGAFFKILLLPLLCFNGLYQIRGNKNF